MNVHCTFIFPGWFSSIRFLAALRHPRSLIWSVHLNKSNKYLWIFEQQIAPLAYLFSSLLFSSVAFVALESSMSRFGVYGLQTLQRFEHVLKLCSILKWLQRPKVSTGHQLYLYIFKMTKFVFKKCFFTFSNY